MSKYYSIERIKKVDAQYKLLLGGRNIGKSYATKHDVIKECFNTGSEFIYLRRWDEDVKPKNAINYFADVDVNKITNGAYQEVYINQSIIYFVNRDDKNKIVEKYILGYTHALNQGERYKSQIFPKVIYIIYEEVITDRLYLADEPDKLQNYVSTIFRDRTGVVYLIGNTISKLCPYFNAWNLDKVSSMKTHDIAIFENSTEILTDNGVQVLVVKVAVEMCGASSILSKMAFGDSASMIVKNNWKTKSVARIDLETYNRAYLMHLIYVYCENLCFRMELLSLDGNIFWYIMPQTRPIKDEENTRIITENVSMYPLHTNGFTPLNENERVAFNLIKQNKIFYCSNSCGSDFEQVLKHYRMK